MIKSRLVISSPDEFLVSVPGIYTMLSPVVFTIYNVHTKEGYVYVFVSGCLLSPLLLEKL